MVCTRRGEFWYCEDYGLCKKHAAIAAVDDTAASDQHESKGELGLYVCSTATAGLLLGCYSLSLSVADVMCMCPPIPLLRLQTSRTWTACTRPSSWLVRLRTNAQPHPPSMQPPRGGCA